MFKSEFYHVLIDVKFVKFTLVQNDLVLDFTWYLDRGRKKNWCAFACDVQYPVLQDIKDDIYECHNINYNYSNSS